LYYTQRVGRDFVEKNLNNISASFQRAVIEVLVKKTLHAAESFSIESVSVTGGVAANSQLREEFFKEGKSRNLRIYFPPLDFCTDNGAMIALAGGYRLERGECSGLDLTAVPNLKL
ncbi:MAG: carbamoyltransferase N-terminal domain-containing protein, partial [Fidelibacterota bacterium]